MASTGGSQKFMIYEKLHRILPLRRRKLLSPKQHTSSSWGNRGESFAVAIAVFILNFSDFQTIQNEQGIVADCIQWTMVGWWPWVWANSGTWWWTVPGVTKIRTERSDWTTKVCIEHLGGLKSLVTTAYSFSWGILITTFLLRSHYTGEKREA